MDRSRVLLLLAAFSLACSSSSPAALPTPEEIMADGVVSDEERELARRAVECLADAGADTTFELFDVDPVVQRDYPEAYQRCLFDYAVARDP